jgi:hypothetical protein
MSSFDRDEAWLSEHSTVLVTPKLRIGWDLAFAEMAAQHEDTLLDDVIRTDWDQWEWSPIIIPSNSQRKLNGNPF